MTHHTVYHIIKSRLAVFSYTFKLFAIGGLKQLLVSDKLEELIILIGLSLSLSNIEHNLTSCKVNTTVTRFPSY